MSAINDLPSSPYWSIVNKDHGLCLLSQPKKVFKLYRDHVINELTGERLSYSGVSYLEDYLSRKKLTESISENDQQWVVHAFYELGAWWNDDGKNLKETVSGEQLLGLILEYQEEVLFEPHRLKEQDLDISWKSPNPLAYEKAFNKGQEHLRNGDCYQYNLTFPYYGTIHTGGLSSLIKKLWSVPDNRGEFAGVTVVGEEFFLSNTPECLFEWSPQCEDTGLLETKPIKGTQPLHKSSHREQAWTDLKNSQKDESELFMITDLLRNDLNRIEKAQAQVIKLKAPLVVPGLIHSYSHIQVELSRSVSLLKIMKSLFPGGSITGAPKMRVMRIINALESGPRGFYCGSTLFSRGQKIVGSINIRSAIGNHKTGAITYHAGGGITVKSSWESEYQEMENKFLSFQSLLTSR